MDLLSISSRERLLLPQELLLELQQEALLVLVQELLALLVLVVLVLAHSWLDLAWAEWEDSQVCTPAAEWAAWVECHR